MSAPDWTLARRAVACPHWRWVPGMLLNANERLVGIDPEGIPYGHSHTAGHRVWLGEGSLPDLTDPATIGCLLALVREAWGPTFHLIPQGGWLVQGARLPGGGTINLGICATTEAEALVAALEVLP